MSARLVARKVLKMLLPWLLVTLASVVFLYYKFTSGKNSSVARRKSGNLWLILTTVYKFIFKVKSEDRLDAFKQIHKVFPRFTRIKIFNFDLVAVYDPEILKKVFAAQTCCQRPFRNCLQLEYGLLSSECEF